MKKNPPEKTAPNGLGEIVIFLDCFLFPECTRAERQCLFLPSLYFFLDTKAFLISGSASLEFWVPRRQKSVLKDPALKGQTQTRLPGNQMGQLSLRISLLYHRPLTQHPVVKCSLIVVLLVIF